MVQHKDLMKFPLQLWLGLLCYCCGTQSTSILPVLLLGGCGGYSCHLSWSAYIYPEGYVSEPSFLPSASPLLWMDWSLPPNLPPLFERLLVRVAWMFQSVQGLVLVFAAATSGSLVLLAPRVGGPGSAWPSAFVLAMFLHQSGSLAWLGERSWTDDWDA